MSKKNKAKWSNLTEAIKNGDPIDWEALEKTFPRAMLTCHEGKDCCKVKGHLRTSGAKNTPLEDIDGWILSGPTEFGLSDLMHDGWNDSGWGLWLEGEIPMCQLTAADLPLGTCFKTMSEELAVVIENRAGEKLVDILGGMFIRDAINVEVLEVYGVGTLKKPQEEA